MKRILSVPAASRRLKKAKASMRKFSEKLRSEMYRGSIVVCEGSGVQTSIMNVSSATMHNVSASVTANKGLWRRRRAFSTGVGAVR